MRVSNHSSRLGAGLATLATIALLVAACGGPPPASPSPTTRPTPVITPDPHLTEPVTADEIFTAIRSGDLPLAVNNATAGDPNSPIVKRINADIGNWPLIISEYRSGAQLRELIAWDSTAPPVQGDPPYAFVALNVLVEFGPITGPLAAPDARRREQAEVLVRLLDPLLWPIEQRSVRPVAVKTAVPASIAPSAAASAAASAAP